MFMYNHQEIEKKWQKYWKENNTFKTSNTSLRPKYYVLDMFPYPSGAGLHVGHPEGYTANDIVARYKHARGHNVLHPMGWDAFGLPAENYAIKTGTHPRITTDENIATFKRQIQELGFSYDWDREIDTTDPKYFQWTQWIFLKLFEHGLAYEQDLPINYCPSCKTGLANEEVLGDFSCERCGTTVEKKKIRQWVLGITQYAERLLTDVDDLDWPEGIKDMQRNWIGKNTWVKYTLKVKDTDLEIQTYSTHFEAFYADTFAVIAADHELLSQLLDGIDNKEEILDFAKKISNKKVWWFSDEKESEWIFTWRYLIDPITKNELELWISSYALSDYGTWIIKCSAHDERDFAFAKKYNLPLRAVMYPKWATQEDIDSINNFEYCYNNFWNAILELPKEFKGRRPHEAHEDIIKYLVDNNFAEQSVQYKLRDWLFSRQRYWGEPIPLVHLERDDVRALPRVESLDDEMEVGKAYVLKTDPDSPPTPLQERGVAAASSLLEGENWERSESRTLCSKWQVKSLVIDGKIVSKIYSGIYTDIICDYDLPLELPQVEAYEPAGDGTSPLTKVDDFVHVQLAENFSGKRETNTMPQWGGSCWYYLRFMDNKNPDELVGKTIEDYWGSVDSYVGGAEHAVLHLLYARFWHKFLFDIGVVSTSEPFYRLRNQGMILGMSYRNSKGKLIASDLVEEKGGKYIDTETWEELEKIPAKMSKSLKNVINPDDIVTEYGADTLRLYEMYMADFKDAAPWDTTAIIGVRRLLDKVHKLFIENSWKQANDDNEAMKTLHKATKKIGEDIDNYKFNTAIAQLMICMNTWEPTDADKKQEWRSMFIRLLHPFAPHMAEECWEKIAPKREEILKVYFATGNDGKIKRAQSVLDTLRSKIQLQAIPELIEVEESGATPLECALQKIEAYRWKQYKIPVIAGDTAVYFENQDFDPTKVRRAAIEKSWKNESELSKQEIWECMVDFYKDIASKNGGSIDFYYIDSWAMLLPNWQIQTCQYRREYILTDTCVWDINPNTPMRSLYISKVTWKREHETTMQDYIKEFACQAEAFEELFDLQGGSVFFTQWPEYDEAMTVDSEVTIGVQVLGKLRGEVQISIDEDKDSVLEKAKSQESVVKWLEGKTLIKEIYVPGKIVNLVVK